MFRLSRRYGLSTDWASELERLYRGRDVERRGPTTGLSVDCAICTLFAASQGSRDKFVTQFHYNTSISVVRNNFKYPRCATGTHVGQPRRSLTLKLLKRDGVRVSKHPPRLVRSSAPVRPRAIACVLRNKHRQWRP